MAVRPITVIGHKALHQPTRKVREVTDEIRTLVADMYDTMEAAEGVGLAANQVGVRLRIFVYDCPTDDGGRARGEVINPVLERLGNPSPLNEDEDGEGCLSVPGEYFPLARHPRARVTGTDLEGNEILVEGEGYLARCLQHETDHLDGYLYVDRLTGPWKREARETVKDRGWAANNVTKWDPATEQADKV
ncbi:peptide deformylase [Ornithinicoccus hortensis]|uniref:Peptide deformylase n=1 Tax=Ornithinicoccus hortensis TaxID=82346 RepID=A0A542YP05_9MICO|nr:peptide deformylase [Ornithinicoccus hortensis]TQL49654.1 peptide deformylase [Ornithinicoccus hortensis]